MIARRADGRLTPLRWMASFAIVVALGGTASGLSTSSSSDGREPTQTRCPYDFGSDMPAGEFCVYLGAITAADGTVCVEEAVAIWSSHGATAASDGDRRETDAPRDVFIGFLEPLLVMRAVAPARLSARLVDYGPIDGPSKTSLDGLTTLERRVAEPGSITMKLRGPLALGTGAERCEFESYRGVFVGLMHKPNATESVRFD